MLFLSTPHRGTNLAKLLNRVLSVSIFSHSKQYIAELTRNSSSVEDLNEVFRNLAPRLRIFSFYETLQTVAGPKTMVSFASWFYGTIPSTNALQMVLEKDSSILGYPGEVSQPLNADHHDVCKFTSQQDPNYKSVRSVLKTLVSTYIELGMPSLYLRYSALRS